jgi:hypothetical protein
LQALDIPAGDDDLVTVRPSNLSTNRRERDV